MKKFVIYTDNKSNSKTPTDPGYEYKLIEAEGIEEAIEIADSMWNDGIYLMRIMKKVGKIQKEDGEWRAETYEAVLARRSFGWHLNNEKNSECRHVAKRHYTNSRKYTTNLEWIGACEA